jgi:hypothetical protein
MLKKTKQILLIALLIVLVSNCAKTQSILKSDPESFYIDNNPYFTASIKPFEAGKGQDKSLPGRAAEFFSWPSSTRILNNVMGYKGFTLCIKNKTDKTLKLDWNKTYYLVNDQPYGRFYYKGVFLMGRKDFRPPSLILPNGNFLKDIYPNDLLKFHGSWWFEELPEGENGVYLTVMIGEMEINEKMVVNIKRELIE